MKAALALLCVALAACDGNQSARPPNGSIAGGLHRGMTEQQVSQASSDRVPDRVIMKTCGTETPKPFACKVYVYDRPLRGGQNDPKLSVVFEKINGRWLVTQWF
jgi:hypothetical protein